METIEMNLAQYCKIVANAQDEFRDTVAKASAVLQEKLASANNSFMGDRNDTDYTRKPYCDDAEIANRFDRKGSL